MQLPSINVNSVTQRQIPGRPGGRVSRSVGRTQCLGPASVTRGGEVERTRSSVCSEEGTYGNLEAQVPGSPHQKHTPSACLFLMSRRIAQYNREGLVWILSNKKKKSFVCAVVTCTNNTEVLLFEPVCNAIFLCLGPSQSCLCSAMLLIPKASWSAGFLSVNAMSRSTFHSASLPRAALQAKQPSQKLDTGGPGPRVVSQHQCPRKVPRGPI